MAAGNGIAALPADCSKAPKGMERQSARGYLGCLVLTLAVLLCKHPDAIAAGAPRIVIYYANETLPNALLSTNYRALFSLLAEIENSAAAATTRAALEEDARRFSQRVQRDVASLVSASKRVDFDLYIFTNEYAIDSKFLYSRGGNTAYQQISWPSKSRGPVTASSPLALRYNFEAALSAALSDSNADSEIVLIINSHGTKTFAIVPRVAADFTNSAAAGLRLDLNEREGADLALKSIQLEGITKTSLWQSIARVAAARHLKFSLVSLLACESAVSSWNEYMMVPSSVDTIMHTGFDSLDTQAVDFADLAPGTRKEAGSGLKLAMDFERVFSAAGMHAENWRTIWRWPMLVAAASVPSWLYFMPLSIWVLINISLSKSFRALIPSRLRRI